MKCMHIGLCLSRVVSSQRQGDFIDALRCLKCAVMSAGRNRGRYSWTRSSGLKCLFNVPTVKTDFFFLLSVMIFDLRVYNSCNQHWTHHGYQDRIRFWWNNIGPKWVPGIKGLSIDLGFSYHWFCISHSVSNLYLCTNLCVLSITFLNQQKSSP